MKKGILWGLGALVALGLSYFAGAQSEPKTTGNEQVRSGQYQYINPLLECNAGTGLSQQKIDFRKSLTEKVETLSKSGKLRNVALYYRDLNNGPVFGINQNSTFFPGSLGKLPLAMAVYKQAEADIQVLDKSILFDTVRVPPAELGYMAITTELQVGKSYTPEELVYIMLRYSDNQAAILLSENVSNKYINEIYQLLGIDGDRFIENASGQMGVRQYSAFLRILYNSSYLTKEDSNKILSILAEAEFMDGLKAGIPAGTKISNKFGSAQSNAGYPQMHDCGIIYYPSRPYLLCVMTEGLDQFVMEETIKNISSFVFQEVNKQNE